MDHAQVKLDATGFMLLFKPVSLTTKDGWIDVETILYVKGQSPIFGVSSFLSASDLLRLADHLVNYVTSLQHHSHSSAHAFVPVNLGFEIELIDGEAFEEGNGEILLRIMLNVGTDDSGTRIYAGAMGPMLFYQVDQFKSSVHAFVEELK